MLRVACGLMEIIIYVALLSGIAPNQIGRALRWGLMPYWCEDPRAGAHVSEKTADAVGPKIPRGPEKQPMRHIAVSCRKSKSKRSRRIIASSK